MSWLSRCLEGNLFLTEDGKDPSRVERMEAISARLYFFFYRIKCRCLQPYCLCKLADFRFRGLQIDEHINLPCGDSHSQVLGFMALETIEDALQNAFTYLLFVESQGKMKRPFAIFQASSLFF